MTAYPSAFPSPAIEGFTATVASGVIRDSSPVHEAQRRVYTTMPHTFALTFTMSVAVWASWYQWATTYGYRWFTLNLPTMYAGLAGTTNSAVLVRFTSDLAARNVTATDVQVTVNAESAPSMIGAYLDAT